MVALASYRSWYSSGPNSPLAYLLLLSMFPMLDILLS